MLIYFLFLAGFPLLIFGADTMVRGASSIALRLGISELTVGLTVVAMGTSAPELVVALMSASQGANDLAIGNVVGSNISNILLILGVSAVVCPIAMQKDVRWREIPFTVLSTIVLVALANDGLLHDGGPSAIDRGDGIALLGFLLVFLYYTFSVVQQQDVHALDIKAQVALPRSIAMVVGGVLGLIVGGKWIVDGAVDLASQFGMSQGLIGLTVVAIGTSLPELATSVVAARKGKAGIVVGNVIGSNVLNLLWILGITSVILPIRFNPALNTDIWFLLGVTALFFLFTFTLKRNRIDRPEGVVFLALYAGYLIFLINRG